MVDLVRDARWGRCLESTGEDPYMNSLYAKAMVEGFQKGMSDGAKEPKGDVYKRQARPSPENFRPGTYCRLSPFASPPTLRKY